MKSTELNNRELMQRLNATVLEYANECGCVRSPLDERLDLEKDDKGYVFSYTFILQPLVERE